MSVTKEEAGKIARLAALDPSAVDDELISDLSRIIEFAAGISAVDTAGLDPTTHVLDLKNVLREDIPHASLSREDATCAAPLVEKGCFVVPRIVPTGEER